MKTKVYTITYSSYDEFDNCLNSEVRITNNRIDAIKLYEEWRDKAKSIALGEDDEYSIGQVETSLSEQNISLSPGLAIPCKKYEVEREVGTEYGYQAIVELIVTEL